MEEGERLRLGSSRGETGRFKDPEEEDVRYGERSIPQHCWMWEMEVGRVGRSVARNDAGEARKGRP